MIAATVLAIDLVIGKPLPLFHANFMTPPNITPKKQIHTIDLIDI